MKTHILRSRRFASGCVVALLLPWGGTCGEDAASSPQEPSLGTLIRRIDKVQEKGIAYDNANPPSSNWGGWTTLACQLVGEIEKLGDRAALPFLEEKSLMTNAPRTLRARAATAFVNISDLEEGVEFMRKISVINDNEGYWRSTIVPLFLQKVEAAIASRSISKETLTRVLSVLLTYVQSPANSQEADYVDGFLVRQCGGYTNSIQRLSMAQRFSDGGNDLEKKHFIPIKESVEALPKKQRIDLRKRFPDLPPLTEDKNAGTSLKVALGIGAAFVAVCVGIWIMAKHRKP